MYMYTYTFFDMLFLQCRKFGEEDNGPLQKPFCIQPGLGPKIDQNFFFLENPSHKFVGPRVIDIGGIVTINRSFGRGL